MVKWFILILRCEKAGKLQIYNFFSFIHFVLLQLPINILALVFLLIFAFALSFIYFMQRNRTCMQSICVVKIVFKIDKKRKAKKDLLLNVKDWINLDKNLAKMEFEKSAVEVIDFLKNLLEKLG